MVYWWVEVSADTRLSLPRYTFGSRHQLLHMHGLTPDPLCSSSQRLIQIRSGVRSEWLWEARAATWHPMYVRCSALRNVFFSSDTRTRKVDLSLETTPRVKTIRVHIIRHARTHYVVKYQSCMFLNVGLSVHAPVVCVGWLLSVADRVGG